MKHPLPERRGSRAIACASFLGVIASITYLVLDPGLSLTIRALVGLALILCVGWWIYEIWVDPWLRGRSIRSDSGIDRFVLDFSPPDIADVLAEVTSEFCYFGVSFHSVWTQFIDWYKNSERKNVNPSIKLLIADPEASALMNFWAGWGGASPSEEITATIRKRIELTIGEVISLGAPRIEIRLHREVRREWLYLVNGSKIFAGFIQKGVGRDHNPIVVLVDKQQTSGWNLFDHYKQEWETLWAAGIPVPEIRTSAHKEAATVAAVSEVLSRNPNAARRISLLREMHYASPEELHGMFELVISEEFLGCGTEEVRKSAAHWLEECEARCSPEKPEATPDGVATKLMLREQVAFAVLMQNQGDPCRPIRAACAKAFLPYFDGTRFGRLESIVKWAGREGMRDLAEDCLNRICHYSNPDADDALYQLAKDCGHDIQKTCLERLMERVPLRLSERLRKDIRTGKFKGDNADLADELSRRVDPGAIGDTPSLVAQARLAEI